VAQAGPGGYGQKDCQGEGGRYPFARMVYRLALHHEPPTAELAPRMLLALQDAAEPMVRTVPVYPTALASPLHRDRLLAPLDILKRQSMWLARWRFRSLPSAMSACRTT
jgi:hypothetical protein